MRQDRQPRAACPAGAASSTAAPCADRPSHAFRSLVALLFLGLLLAGCSAVRMGYDRMPVISYWWLDSYFDFDSAQEAQIKRDLREIHRWHRTTQLPGYADLLAAGIGRTLDDATPAGTCRDIDAALDRFETFVLHLAPYLARWARQLKPAQLAHLRRAFAEKDADWREEWLDPTPDEMAKKRFDDWLDRADRFYGDISAEQKAFMKEAIARSAFDPKISWDHRQARQQDMLATLAKIIDSGAGERETQAEIDALLDRTLHGKDPAYRAMFRQLLDETCANVAGLHQLTTRQQRLHARDKLAGYERDFRILTGN